MYQHGKYRLPDRAHGYCTDDNCRALGLVARQSKLGKLDAQQLRLAYVYASFVNHAWNPDTGRFRNFMSFDRQWLDDGGSNDCCARTFEALVDVARSDLPDDLRNWAIELGQRVWPRALTWTSMRSRAIVLKTLIRAFGVIGQPQDIQAAVRDLTLSIPRGAAYGLLGPNGAGKTTTLRMVMNIIAPDAGRVEILGQAASQSGRDRIG